MKPVQLEVGEWWYVGCFIQKQRHPLLKPFIVFRDTLLQEIADCYTFIQAKRLCEKNEVKEYLLGPKAFGF